MDTTRVSVKNVMKDIQKIMDNYKNLKIIK